MDGGFGQQEPNTWVFSRTELLEKARCFIAASGLLQGAIDPWELWKWGKKIETSRVYPISSEDLGAQPLQEEPQIKGGAPQADHNQLHCISREGVMVPASEHLSLGAAHRSQLSPVPASWLGFHLCSLGKPQPLGNSPTGTLYPLSTCSHGHRTAVMGSPFKP